MRVGSSSLAVFVVAQVLVTLGATSAYAADVYLRAESFDKLLPDGSTVPMWGFASCDADWVACGTPTAPGPQIELSTTDTLTIHLENGLLTPVSMVVPGQGDAGDPVWTTDALGRRRVQSFTHETAPGARADYTVGPLRAGTYLYQSGTHPSIQVPMGLYGAFVVRPEPGLGCLSGVPAYEGLESCHDADAVLLLSEIDPWLNAAIDAAGADVTAYPSTIDYAPSWFLVNGEASAPMPAGDPGDNVLLRFLNAGLHSHTPAIVGLEMGLLAEDGFPYPGLLRQQSHALLPAGKTLDVLVAMPTSDATYSLFDRMPSSSSGASGGLLAELEVGAGSTPPPAPTVYAVDDHYVLAEDTSTLAASVLANDVGLASATVTVVSGPQNGDLVLAPDGTFTYSPHADFAGADGFTYSASDGTNSYAAQVTLDVSFANDAPVAADDGPYVNAIGPDIVVAAPGVLGNDADADGDTLTAVLDAPPASGTLTLNPDGSFSYVGGTPGTTVTFTYHAEDDLSASDPVIVTLIVNPVADIALTVQDPAGAAVTDYRWIVQEDATFHVDPYAPPPLTDTLSTRFHKSYMPIVAQGRGAAEFAQVALDPAKHYYVSVLPDDAGTETGHAMGGAQIPPGTTALTVLVNNHPVPTAQISVFVYEDDQPTNGAPDPLETGLGGFQITLEDAGGRFGISGGPMSQDVFGQPLRNALDCFGDAEPPMGVIVTCPDGTALIKDLPPGKYGVVVDAPAGSEGSWSQTATIEGTRVVDAWVQAGEPPYFSEFGGPGYHTWFGFVNPEHTKVPEEVPAELRTNSVQGNVTNLHFPHPPSVFPFDSGSYDAFAFTRAWVGLNSIAGDGPNFASVHADESGHFEIVGIPDGLYQLVIWDDYLDQIIAFQTVTLSGGTLTDVGNIPVNAWFARLEHNVFLDGNEDGVRQEGEAGLPEQLVNLRFRDGSVYQSFPTDNEGFVPFDEIFPFFAWQVAEVDYARFKPTGVTVTVDGGGDVSAGPYPGLLNPQVGSPRTDTEPAPVLLEGFQGMPGQTSIFEWGKAPYQPGENGGISGVVYYASTRGENDPRLTVGDPWEAGVPGAKVRLYREIATDFEGGTALALVEEVETDSWDASIPDGCPGEENPSDPFVAQTLDGDATRCFDGWRNWNQVRPAVFDGGYAFTDIAPGTYVVEVVPPPGFELVKEEDKNVDFGDVFATAPVDMMLPSGAMITIMPDQAMVLASTGPEPGIAQPPCVGAPHLVPDELSLFPGVETYAPFADTERPLCDRKQVVLSDQGQAVADFHLFSSTPVAAQFYGLITDDVANETDPAAPGFGEKFGPAFMPFALRDRNGHTVYRGYSDAFGMYNGVVPSTISANIPIPSGYSPAMYSTCLNDPGDGPAPDPLRDTGYGTYCYTFQFMPRTTTYLDTPVLPQAAFAAGHNPVDCAPEVGTPVVTRVDGTGTGPLVARGGTLRIYSAGLTEVANPAYEGPTAAAPWNQPTVMRDFGFGNVRGTVTVNGRALQNVTWTDGVITGRVPNNASSGQLVVTRGDNGETAVNTVTVTVGTETPVRVTPGPGAIQAAIDAAAPGALILVEPGTYDELVVMWKPVRLQGSGASTVINAAKLPIGKLDLWREKVQGLVDGGAVDLLPGEPTQLDLVGGGLFATELGAGVTVLAKNDGSFGNFVSRIDGLTVTGADIGGGIFVNGYAHELQISNNHVTGNSGTVHGGIRIGKSFVDNTGDGPFGYNTGVGIHHNAITLNGGIGEDGFGGGVSLGTGSDDYRVSENFICGNYAQGDGAGIGHFGLSDGGRIDHNEILFNQSFYQGQVRSGGGIYIAGEPAQGIDLTLGSGDVRVDANLIQGNQAGSGHGGGIRTERVNGVDVEGSPTDPDEWYRVDIINNIIVDNVAGWSGGGISLQDTANGVVVFNTIANNDSTATVGGLFNATTGTSTPQPAGISSEPHSLALDLAIPNSLAERKGFSNPALTHNIVWHNRAFSYEATLAGPRLAPVLAPSAVGDCPAGADYWDFGVLDPSFALRPRFSLTTDGTGQGNFSADPDFLDEYCNGARSLSVPGPMQAVPAIDEGGNFIDVRYGPLTRAVGGDPWDYHIAGSSPAIDYRPGTAALRRLYQDLIREGREPFTQVERDFDDERRRNPVDLGADEVVQ